MIASALVRRIGIKPVFLHDQAKLFFSVMWTRGFDSHIFERQTDTADGDVAIPLEDADRIIVQTVTYDKALFPLPYSNRFEPKSKIV